MSKCKEETCRAEIYFLLNPKTGRTIPVDAESMYEDEIRDYKNKTRIIQFDNSRHISHYKTCKAPNKFSKSKK